MWEYSDVFALSDSELGCTDSVHFIDTGAHCPFEHIHIKHQLFLGRRMIRC